MNGSQKPREASVGSGFAFDITALKSAGKNMEAPTPETAEARMTIIKEESTFIVKNINVAIINEIAPKVVRFLVPYLSDNRPIIGLRKLPAT